MDGRAHERDDLGDTHNFQRFGHDSTPEDDAYGDEAGPDTPPGAGPLPRRFVPADSGTVRWGDPDPDHWRASGGGRPVDPPPGGYEIPGLRPPAALPPVGQPPIAQQPFAQPPFAQPPFAQPPFGQQPFGRAPAQPSYGAPPGFAGADPSNGGDRLPQRRDGYGRGGYGAENRGIDGRGLDSRGPDSRGPDGYETDGYGEDGPGLASGGFAVGSFGTLGEPGEDRIVTLPGPVDLLDDPAEARVRSRLGRRGRDELGSSRGRKVVRRGRVEDEDDESEVRARRSMPLWQELPLLLVVAFCLAVLIRTFLLQAFFIPSGSMEQTLLVGDRVLVNKIVYDVRPPERGEVVVFRGTDNWAPENYEEPSSGLLGRIGRTMGDLVGVSRPGEKDFIKRVIGLPGDRVSCCDPAGRVYVNGQGIDEPYVLNNSPLDVPPDPRVCRSRRFDEVLVPPGQIFVMGDHRIVSQDARCQGPVPIENVIGRAFVIVWPSSRWDTLTVPDTFTDVPGPVALGPPGGAGTGVRVGAAVVTLPILASLVVTTRTGRKPRWGRRTLRK